MDLSHFDQLLTRNAALFCCIGFHEAAVHRQMCPLHQSHFHALLHDLLKQLLEQLRLLKPSVAVLRERGMVWNLLIETQTREPSPSQMHAQLFHQLALTGNTVQIADQQNAQQEFGINRRPPGLAVTVFQLLPHKVETDVLVDSLSKWVSRTWYSKRK